MSRGRRFSLLLLAMAVACGPFRRGGPPDPVVIFNNQSLDQVDVYAVRSGGFEVRVGTVMSNRRELLRVPPSVASAGSDFNITARPLASSRLIRTGALQLATGDTIEVTLPSDGRGLIVLPPRTP
jgi:hypothetical protein